MKTLLLRHDYKEAAAELKGQHPAPSHADQIIDVDTVVIAPDGSIPAVLLKQKIDPALSDRAYELWKTVDELPSNRATAVGSRSLHRIKKNQTLSGRKGVPLEVLEVLEDQGVRHGILGYVDATADQACHTTPLTIERPEMLSENQILIERVDSLYADHVPSLYAVQRAEVEKAPDWRLWKTAFTTVYIIKMLRSAYHPDRGNLRGVMSAITPMGKFTGGELILSRWRLGIAFIPGDLLLFDPQHLHGNLPFEGERLSAIFYCERRIAECCGK
jgi:hypothetical protein